MTPRPRRIPPTPQQRANRILTQTRGAHSAQGAVPAARPVSSQDRARLYNPAGLGPGQMGRLTVNWFTGTPSTTLAAHAYDIAAWNSTFDSNGTQAALNPGGDDGGIYFFTPGVYAVNLLLEVAGISAAPVNCQIRAACTVWDVAADSGEVFDVAVTGLAESSTLGWSPSPGASRIFYSPGGGVAGGGVTFQILQANIDPALATVWVLATVQQLA